jgi:hypothetical protein
MRKSSRYRCLPGKTPLLAINKPVETSTFLPHCAYSTKSRQFLRCEFFLRRKSKGSGLFVLSHPLVNYGFGYYEGELTMPRPPRADEAGGLYHALNRGRPLVDGEMGRFMGWVGGTHTMRYHAHYQTSGLGHVYQQRYKSFPIQDDEHFFVVCRYVERNALRSWPRFQR